MSKYKNITALVPAGEHFDESAVGEGVWVSTNHLNGIESALEANAEAVQAVQTQLDAATETVNANAVRIEQITNELTTANSTITERDAEITRLNAEVTRLSGKPSGSGTKLAGVKADITAEEEENTVKYDDPNHPANVAADKATKKYQGWRKQPA